MWFGLLFGMLRIFAIQYLQMTAKELFLKRLTDQISMLQAAFDFNKNLPDSFFEGLQDEVVAKPASIPTSIDRLIGSSLAAPSKIDYGANKRAIIKILNETQRVLTKADITKLFEAELQTTEDQTGAVTNALSGLTSDNSIKGYKPQGVKLRGYFWGLINWFDGEELKDTHKPLIQNDIFTKYNLKA